MITLIIYELDKFLCNDSGVSEDLKAYIIELPYEGEAISMFILLPPFTPNALQETISRLNASTIREAMDGMYHDSIEIFLPRFKIQQTMDLSQVRIHTFQQPTFVGCNEFIELTKKLIAYTLNYQTFVCK